MSGRLSQGNKLECRFNFLLDDPIKLNLAFQMLDMIIPEDPNRISMRDLKGCRMTPIFFDTFFNLEKYLDHEQRDPFASQRDLDEDGNEVGLCFDTTYVLKYF